jgi:hypothetical protein
MRPVNIDYRGEVLDELSGRVVVGDDGRPRLEPQPGTAARWRVVLTRHAGRGPLRVVLSRVNERRSAAQNRLLWRVYTEVLSALRERAAELGERCPFPDEEALHEAMKYLFIGATVSRFDGREYEIPPTSTTLDTGQFSRFVGAVAAYWAERGIYVELPEAS